MPENTLLTCRGGAVNLLAAAALSRHLFWDATLSAGVLLALGIYHCKIYASAHINEHATQYTVVLAVYITPDRMAHETQDATSHR